MNSIKDIYWCGLLFFICAMALLESVAPSFAQQASSAKISLQSPSVKVLTGEDETTRIANANTVLIMASGSSSIFTRLAEEMQQVLDTPDENSLRILPVIGNSGEQNMLDVLYLGSIDMGIMDDQMIEYFKKVDPKRYGNIDQRVRLIAKLLDSELHLVARNDIRSIEDLRGKKVNFYQPKSSTAILSENLFKILDIQVIPVYYHQPIADKMLLNGEIAAVARANGAPVAFVQQYKQSDGVHFLPIDTSVKNYDKLLALYSPAFLEHDDYPSLIPEGQRVPTIANATVLATYAWPENSDRYRRVANFVNKFFDHIDKLMIEPHHPKWRNINLAANVTGWKRFKAAEDWLSAHKSRTSDSGQVRAAFEQFLKTYKKSNPDNGLDDSQTEGLTLKFFQWWDTQKATSVGR